MPVRFGDCVFDPGTRQVLRAGKQVRISPKAFQLLEVLIGRRPNAVSKEKLQEILWPDTYVSDGNLPNLVADLRLELGDSPRSSRIIRTVQRFGYAFVATPLSPGHTGSRGHAYRIIWGNREIALGEGENLIGSASMTFRVLDKTASTATAAEQKDTKKDGGLASRRPKR